MRTRCENWETRLREVVDRYRAGTYSRGTMDCATLWADAVLAVSGKDTADFVRFAYTTKQGALRVLRNNGAERVSDMANRLFQPCPARLLQRGDLASVPGTLDNELAPPAVVLGSQAATYSETDGLVLLPLQIVPFGWLV